MVDTLESPWTEHVKRQALDVPDPWNHAGKVHDWRNHIGSNVEEIWATFSDEQKLAIALDADASAGAENWE